MRLTSTRVLTPEGLRPATLRLAGPRIEALEPHGHPEARDLGDHVLMQGLIDTHVHVNEPGRAAWEGWHTATTAAALGGVTTLGDMPLNSLPVTTTLDALRAKQASTEGKLHIDVALWGGVVPGNTAELAPMVQAGVRGFKCFLCPSGIDEFPEATRSDLEQAMPALRELGVPLLAHAELELPLREAANQDPRDYATYLHSRPPEWEDAAVALLIELSERTGCPVHVVHLSSAGSIDPLRAAKARGVRITAETCPHYLCLKAEDVPAGATAFKCAPPIREGANREALWKALGEGVIDFVVTDHSPCVPGLKLPEEGDFLRAWGGIASLQLGLASVATEARRRGHGLAEIAGWMTAGPARLLGWDRGALVPGTRADLVAWDPDQDWTVRASELAHRNPITPYEGRRLQGRVHDVWLRGQHIVREGRLTGPPRGEIWSP
jgi:allantoinase